MWGLTSASPHQLHGSPSAAPRAPSSASSTPRAGTRCASSPKPKWSSAGGAAPPGNDERLSTDQTYLPALRNSSAHPVSDGHAQAAAHKLTHPRLGTLLG